jgi:hypothetical protein
VHPAWLTAPRVNGAGSAAGNEGTVQISSNMIELPANANDKCENRTFTTKWRVTGANATS